MRIKSVQIRNFRSIVECEFEFPNLIALVGENNAGKSNILYALDLFFNKNKPTNVHDFFNLETPIEIEIQFNGLTDYEKSLITEEHRTGDEFVLRKSYTYEENEFNYHVTSVKDGEGTNIPPRGPQNVVADVLPEIYILPAVKEVGDETKMTSTTNFGKLLNQLFDEEESQLRRLDDLLGEISDELKREDPDAPLIKIAMQLTEILQEQFITAEVSFEPTPLNRVDILKTLEVYVNDGHNSPLANKGHGLQRAFIFTCLRLWADKLNRRRPSQEKEKKAIILAIEEPELYLHPHQQRVAYELLKELSLQEKEQIQVIYTTHSSFMVHVEDYLNVGIVQKREVSEGTMISQINEELFLENSKQEFRLLCQFDPERNEMFFAKKTILVEGDTEKFSLPLILNKLDVDIIKEGISVIECGSKGGIKLFLEISNAFNKEQYIIDCIVLHDKDIPWRDEEDPERDRKEKQAEEENTKIRELCDENGVPIYIFDPDFEREMDITLRGKNKPYNARVEIEGMDSADFPENLKKFLVENLS